MDKDLAFLYQTFLRLQTETDVENLLLDLCSKDEIKSMAQRVKAAKMLKAGKNYVEVCSATGMSSATISRVSKCLEYGAGGYELAIKRLAEKENEK